MNKETKRKIVIPFTLEQFKDTIERIKAEYNAGNLNSVGLFEIETLEYYCEKAKENEQAQKQEKLLELYIDLANTIEVLDNAYGYGIFEFGEIIYICNKIKELEK